MKTKQKGFTAIEGLLILVVVCIVAFTAGYVWHSTKKANTSYNNASNINPVATIASPKNKSTVLNNQATQTPVQPQTTEPTFNFVDMAGWVKRSPTDGSFSVKFATSESYGYCSDGTGILLIGMVYLNPTNKYTCGGIKNVVTPHQQTNGTLLYTQLAIGPSEGLWDKSGAKSTTVTLPQGEKAFRYDYTNTLNGDTYETIEYDINYLKKSFVAVNHWDTNQNPNPNISKDYFDTIVQKTLNFN